MKYPREKLEAVFEAAAALESDAQRRDYLDRACPDPGFRREVESLLEAMKNPDSLFANDETIPASVLTETPVLEQAGTMIGRYKLLQKIGEGGMGVVYMAEQTEPVTRKVALKIIKLGMDTRQVVARFEAERQALAMMDHPNIAKVLDAGATDTGRPYFVMELVRGVPITEYCDKNKLSTQERLNLFIPVCQAIQHAHQKGVIHRDIKPSNVMVTLNDGVPHPMVIDFGIAKATNQKLTEKTLFTNYAQMIGTPAYMSPEQAEMSKLDVDTRTDVYSLGVLLYELLTGTTPFPAKELMSMGYGEMQRIIVEQEPPKPSTRLSTMENDTRTVVAKNRSMEASALGTTFQGDLDWIVMKALEKDRTHRYETVNGLVSDIRRHLDNEPVSAAAPTFSYQFHKFVRRNRKYARAAAAVAGLLVAATAVASWLAVKAYRAEALASKRLAESEKSRAESEAIAKFITGVFKSPAPNRDGRAINAGEMLDAAAGRLEIDFADQPELRLKLQSTLAQTYEGLYLKKEATALQRKVLDGWRTLKGPEDALTLHAMVRLAIFTPSQKEEIQLREQILEIHRRVHGPAAAETINDVQSLGYSYYGVGRAADALRLFRESLSLSRQVNGETDERTYRATKALADGLGWNRRHDEAIQLLEQFRQTLLEAGVPEARRKQVVGSLAWNHFMAGHYDRAIELWQEDLAWARQKSGADSPAAFESIRWLALSHSNAGHDEEALALGKEAYTARRLYYGDSHGATIRSKFELAGFHLAVGNEAAALKLLESLTASDTFNPSGDGFYAFAAMLHAGILVRSGRTEEYEALCQRWLERTRDTESIYASERIARVACFAPLADLNTRQAARELAVRARDLARSVNSPNRWVHLALGAAEFRLKDYAAAEAALVIPANAGPGDEQEDQLRSAARLYLAMSKFKQGDVSSARRLMEDTEATMRPLPVDEKKPLAGGANHDDLMVWLIYREARDLILGGKRQPANGLR